MTGGISILCEINGQLDPQVYCLDRIRPRQRPVISPFDHATTVAPEMKVQIGQPYGLPASGERILEFVIALFDFRNLTNGGPEVSPLNRGSSGERQKPRRFFTIFSVQALDYVVHFQYPQ